MLIKIGAALNLGRHVRIVSIVVLGCSTTLGVLSMVTCYAAMRTAAGDRAALVRFTDVATALDRIAAERGPTNAALTSPIMTDEVQSSLATSRTRSDAALAVLARDPSIAASTAALTTSLARARHGADKALSKPVNARSPAEIQTTIQGMFDVIDGARDLTGAAMQPIGSGKASTILALAQTVRMLSELRDFAGRMGSALVVPLATDTLVNDDQRSAYDLAHGRVLALSDMLDAAVPLASRGELSLDYRAAWHRFATEGTALFDAALQSGREGHHGMNAADFTGRVIPIFRGLEAVRDRFFAVALEMLDADGRRARYTFIAVSLATLLTVLLECALLFGTQRLIFRPLTTALEAVLGLARGTTIPLPDRTHWGEMRELFAALTLLSSRLRERDALDEQNVLMANRLRRLAERDGLTGILNRGTLERAVERMTAAGTDFDMLGLILLDIDHFKEVNDTYGHGIGDTVLKVTADRMRAMLGEDTTFARFGGEEFAVVLPDRSLAEMRDVAERLRLAIAVPIEISIETTIAVSASFGVAAALCGPQAWSSLIGRADAALYRAKAAGRNTVMCSDEPAPTEARRASAA